MVKKNTKITILLLIIVVLSLSAMFIGLSMDNKTNSIAYATQESAICEIPNENDLFDDGCAPGQGCIAILMNKYDITSARFVYDR